MGAYGDSWDMVDESKALPNEFQIRSPKIAQKCPRRDRDHGFFRSYLLRNRTSRPLTHVFKSVLESVFKSGPTFILFRKDDRLNRFKRI
jgi:hypothetical protein